MSAEGLLRYLSAPSYPVAFFVRKSRSLDVCVAFVNSPARARARVPPQMPARVGPSKSMTYGQLHAWMRKTGCDKSIVSQMDSVLGMHAAVRAGIGVAVLPCYLGEADVGLRRIGNEIMELSVDLWLLAHPDLRHTSRVRAVLDYLGSLQGALV